MPFAMQPGLEHLKSAYQAEVVKDRQKLQALRDGDLDELAHHAHAFGGKCAMMGDLELGHFLYEIERQARAEHRDKAQTMVDECLVLSLDRCP